MKIEEIQPKENALKDPKVSKLFEQLNSIFKLLEERNLPQETVDFINKEVEKINNTEDDMYKFRKQMLSSQLVILNTIQKKFKLVTKNYYKNLWMVLGLSAFGIPLGLVFSYSLDNLAFIGIGMPIGMVLGIVVGTMMDKKAIEQNRVLDVK
ncbi:hypothetical protein [Aureivirga sp. CE67]|uniref:hypothetical protein n=1 Tax=Aureivirga sp. CE67 TaxID=1788983 RepID=UPI0018CB8563|nr:hypothetical protein [Aureivirga sp. CE67]